jgi:hypothetical protein
MSAISRDISVLNDAPSPKHQVHQALKKNKEASTGRRIKPSVNALTHHRDATTTVHAAIQRNWGQPRSVTTRLR